MSSLTDEQRDLFKKSMSDEIIGVINPGDCTQFGENDGSLRRIINDIGSYEYAFNNNKEDNGLLNTSSYECLGNHDYHAEYNKYHYFNFLDKLSKKILGNPLKSMQLRRNKNRKYIINSDDEGNYSCDWGDLHMIFINLWPSHDKLEGAEPKKSIKFLEEDLKIHGHKKWMIITHHIPIPDDEDDFKNVTSMKLFDKIYHKYQNTCLGGLVGHVHVFDLNYTQLNNNFKIHLLPGPAAAYVNYRKFTNIPYFIFDQKNQKMSLFKIISEKINDKLLYKVEFIY